MFLTGKRKGEYAQKNFSRSFLGQGCISTNGVVICKVNFYCTSSLSTKTNNAFFWVKLSSFQYSLGPALSHSWHTVRLGQVRLEPNIVRTQKCRISQIQQPSIQPCQTRKKMAWQTKATHFGIDTSNKMCRSA